ncbi:GAF domain-containing sensor histidine kinase [Anthocerotibacter panamensis]|uniref:GAF domain-containing sensor histidine kinase n=1 Tax=Anthocerotibacter panamensis TaxID=2857077 RepID=UPI001C40860D|nr:ATP-binding protein [Anthocerotibacter panamensis]
MPPRTDNLETRFVRPEPLTLASKPPTREEALGLLAELAEELNATPTLEGLLGTLGRRLHPLVAFDRCTLAVRVATDAYTLYDIFSGGLWTQGETSPLQKGWPGWTITTAEFCIIDPLADVHPPSGDHFGVVYGAKALILLPLGSHGEVFGSLNLSTYEPGAYPPDLRNLVHLLALYLGGHLSALACQQRMALTLEDLTELRQTPDEARVHQLNEVNRALAQQVAQRTAQLQQTRDFEVALQHITDKIRDSLDERQILQTAVTGLAQTLKAKACHAALYSPQKNRSTVCYEACDPDFPSLLGHVVQLEASDSRIEVNAVRLLSQLHCHYEQMLLCPVEAPSGLIDAVTGHLTVVNQDPETPFSDREVRLVQQVADQCAIALRQSRLYQAVQQQGATLERLGQLKDDFLSTVSHELRTPVSNMKMAIHMLKSYPDPRQCPQYLDILERECNREIALINDLLDLHNLTENTRPLYLEEVPLLSWLNQLLQPFWARTHERSQQLELSIAEGMPNLFTERASLERVLVELLNNACKYTPANACILLRCRVNPEALPEPQIELEVSNSGSEIPAVELPFIFEKFYRIPSHDPWQQGGTGLGLSLVKKLVARLGGNIQASSTPALTSFTVSLPWPH